MNKSAMTRIASWTVAAVLAIGCTSGPETDVFARLRAADIKDAPADKLLIVDCLVAGQVRRLGAYATTITPRRPLRVSIAECEAAGGEYVSPHTNPAGALKVWLPFANEGDAQAQVNVGELYERGIAGRPDFAAALLWYERAVAQNDARAMINLAGLYERGDGVARDAAKARALYRRASGLAPATEKPRIQLIDPPAVMSTLRLRSDDVLRVDAAPGPFVISGRVSGDSPVRNVSVNRQTLPVSERGLFSASVVLGQEATPVEIAATDVNGRSAQASFLLALQRPGAPPARLAPGWSSSGSRHALVFANQNYRHYRSLSTPWADAQALRQVLERRFGFEVTVVRDASRREMLAAINQLRSRVSASDQVLIYYAGHGEIDGVTQRGYWVPVDGQPRDLANWISIIDVTDQLAAMPARSVFVIADSCYAGTLTRSAVPEIDQALGEEAHRNALRLLQAQRARIAMTSGGLEPVVDGGGGRHSVFARSLLDVLEHLREPVPAQQLFAAVNARFALLAQRLRLTQQPEYAPIRFAGHESGDFVLAPVQVARAAP